jgi:methyl acetate hydrolase
MSRTPELRAATLDRVLERAVDAGRVPGAAAAVTNAAGVLYRGAFGLAQTVNQRPMRTDTIFRIASMTKLITSVALLRVRDQHRLDLDAPFKHWFPAFRQPEVLVSFDRASRRYTTRPADSDVTVRQLLTHTSGFGYWFLSPEIGALTDGPPEYYNPPFLLHDPGVRFTYGIGTDVAGQAIEALTGQPLGEYFAEGIFAPLGMVDTGFDLPPHSARLASVHARVGDTFVERPRETAGDSPHGGGGLFSTIDDYVALLRLLLNAGAVNGRPFLAAESVREITSNQIGALWAERQTTALPSRTDDFRFLDGTQKFGLGLAIETRNRPSGRTAGSYGWGGICNTYYWVDPAAGLGAVLMMQVSPFSTPACLALCDEFETAVLSDARS